MGAEVGGRERASELLSQDKKSERESQERESHEGARETAKQFG